MKKKSTGGTVDQHRTDVLVEMNYKLQNLQYKSTQPMQIFTARPSQMNWT